ncbi:hypothetical protein INT47_004619 [Mucor saturninus]|uniref:Tc1-like transposase DDE domain-containing protein n=1 Tax=Mucor saturninus TaxID=64648 RepID=A0A8H7RKK3_9FUNG|nr:hypothetical protein INT47_004619 [Mucor saturninus]
MAKTNRNCGIPYELKKVWNDSDGSVYPKGCVKRESKKNPDNTKLEDKHTFFLIELIDKNPCITVMEAKEDLCSKFSDLSGVGKHMKGKCELLLKESKLYTLTRDAPRTLKLRFDIITQWKATGVDYMANCVFMDESGFNAHQIRKRAWARIGEPAIVTVPPQKGVNVSIIGCIAPWGIINFCKVEPLKSSDAALIQKEFPQPEKKKKNEHRRRFQVKGTTAYHVVKFIEATMNILDRQDKKGVFIVMDNCRIHHSDFVIEAINKRGYKPLFLPLYSPFLNPIEECWAKVKKNTRRHQLSKLD